MKLYTRDIVADNKIFAFVHHVDFALLCSSSGTFRSQ